MKSTVSILAIVSLMGVLMNYQASSSATIKGVVTDTLTQTRLDSVLVTIKGTTSKTYTNQQGVFELNDPTEVKNVKIPLKKSGMIEQAIYTINGTTVKTPHGTSINTQLLMLPHGLYFIRLNDKYNGRMLKALVAGNSQSLHNCQENQSAPIFAKVSAATTVLQFSRKYYTGKEQTVNVPDTNISIKLAMFFPDSTNTGVPKGTVLTPSSGLLRVNQAGAVVEHLDLDGSIQIFANNVTIRQCRIHSTSDASLVAINWGYGGYTNTIIEDCELENNGGGATISISDGIVRRCNMHNLGSDGMFISSHSIVEDSYVHGFIQIPGAHNDGIQTMGGTDMIIRHNRVENNLSQTSCVFLEHYGANLDSVTVELNSFDGGGYAIYGGGDNSTYTSSNIHIINNRFGRKYYSTCGYFGFCAHYNSSLPGMQWIGNVWANNGAPVTVN
jgi:hypothetical protein